MPTNINKQSYPNIDDDNIYLVNVYDGYGMEIIAMDRNDMDHYILGLLDDEPDEIIVDEDVTADNEYTFGISIEW